MYRVALEVGPQGGVDWGSGEAEAEQTGKNIDESEQAGDEG